MKSEINDIYIEGFTSYNIMENENSYPENTAADLIWLTGSDEREKAEQLLRLLKDIGNINKKFKKTADPTPANAEQIQKEYVTKDNGLKEAGIVIAGGRCMKQEGFILMEKLAERIGGKTGCTRPCVDAGWAGANHLIGMAGMTVKPKLYLAFGISGAVQHISGMKDSECIVGINTNPKASIFKYCDYGIEGDGIKILECLLEKLDVGK